ncbi:hypothetical protein D3C86_1791930 [compost metagenome]
MAMTACEDGGCHLTCGFEVIEPNGDIQARRLAVHQLDHRNTGDFDHLQGARRVRTFG